MAGAKTTDEKRQYAHEIGTLLVQAKKTDEAVKWMTENFEPNVTQPRDFMALATFYENAGLPPLAELAMERWLHDAKTPEERTEAQFRLAQFALKQKKYDHAEELVNKIAADNKDAATMSRVKTLFDRIEAEKKATAEKQEADKKKAAAVDGPKNPARNAEEER